MMAERGIVLVHTTILRWVQHISERLGKSSSRKIERIFEGFLPFLGQASRAGDPLGRLASEVLDLKKVRVVAALGQELPGDSSHQTRGGQDGDVGPLTKRSLVFVEVPEVSRTADGNPSRL